MAEANLNLNPKEAFKAVAKKPWLWIGGAVVAVLAIGSLRSSSDPVKAQNAALSYGGGNTAGGGSGGGGSSTASVPLDQANQALQNQQNYYQDLLQNQVDSYAANISSTVQSANDVIQSAQAAKSQYDVLTTSLAPIAHDPVWTNAISGYQDAPTGNNGVGATPASIASLNQRLRSDADFRQSELIRTDLVIGQRLKEDLVITNQLNYRDSILTPPTLVPASVPVPVQTQARSSASTPPPSPTADDSPAAVAAAGGGMATYNGEKHLVSPSGFIF